MLEERKVNGSKKKNLTNISLKQASQILDYLNLRNAHGLLEEEKIIIIF